MTNASTEVINTHVNKIGENDQKLTWVLIIDAFCCCFDIFIEESAPKSRIYSFYCYYYGSVDYLNGRMKWLPSGCV